MWSVIYLAEGIFRNCFLLKFRNTYSISFSFLMFLLTLPLLKNNWLGLGRKPAAVTYWHSARPIFSTSQTGPSKCWKIFQLWNGFAWQRWEWMLSFNISYLAYWIKNLLSLKIRIHYTVLNAAGYKLKLLYLSSYISIPNLQQIFQWLLALFV